MLGHGIPGLSKRPDDGLDIGRLVIEFHRDRMSGHVGIGADHTLDILDGCTSRRSGAPSDDAWGGQEVANGLAESRASEYEDQEGRKQSGHA